MSVSTEPWDPAARTALPWPLRHVHYLYAVPVGAAEVIPLDVNTATLTYDENANPFVQLSAGIKVPEDQATLDALDPRAGTRLHLFTGYEYSDGTEDVHLIANLLLDERVVRRPQDDVTLAAYSDELTVQRRKIVRAPRPLLVPGMRVVSAVNAVLSSVLGAPPNLWFDTELLSFDLLDEDAIGINSWGTRTDPWGYLSELSESIGAWLYHDGIDAWHLVTQPERAGAATHALSVGPGGTIAGSETGLTTDGFGNMVALRLEWTDGISGQARFAEAWAEVAAGPYGTTAAGPIVVTVVQSQGYARSSLKAQQVARSLVRRTISRGRQMSIESAAAAYWLRPGDTVTVQLPTGPQERHLVSAVSFDLPTGTMRVRTRVPVDVTITTGE